MLSPPAHFEFSPAESPNVRRARNPVPPSQAPQPNATPHAPHLPACHCVLRTTITCTAVGGVCAGPGNINTRTFCSPLRPRPAPLIAGTVAPSITARLWNRNHSGSIRLVSPRSCNCDSSANNNAYYRQCCAPPPCGCCRKVDESESVTQSGFSRRQGTFTHLPASFPRGRILEKAAKAEGFFQMSWRPAVQQTL